MRPMRALLLLPMLLLAGCGYHQLGSASAISPSVRTVAVPIFASRVQAFATETIFTQAVVRELNTSTRLRVLTSVGNGNESRDEAQGITTSSAAADATLHGTVLSQTVAPLTYDAASGQTSSYLVTITAKAVLTDRDGRVLYQNDAFAWREQYQSTQDLSGSIQEDTPAVRRLGRDFAQSLVSDMMGSFQ